MKSHVEKLLESWILGARRPVPEDHLRSQRVGVQPHNIDELLRLLEQANQHRPVLQVLVGYVRLHGVDVEGVVDNLAHLAPHIPVLLQNLVSEDPVHGLHDINVLPRERISTPRWRCWRCTCPVWRSRCHSSDRAGPSPPHLS
jgi:hypothetical protein